MRYFLQLEKHNSYEKTYDGGVDGIDCAQFM